MELFQLLQYTTSALTPADRAYLNSSLTQMIYIDLYNIRRLGRRQSQMAFLLNTTWLIYPFKAVYWMYCMGPNFEKGNAQIGFTAL